MRATNTLVVCGLFAIACGTSQAAPQAGWYWNPDESGRGFFIESLDKLIYMAGYLYQADGHALWVVSGGPNNDPYNYTGRLLTYNGGQALNGTYRAPQAPQDIGAVSVHFTDDTHAVLTWPGGTVQLQREIYGSGTPQFKPLTGWWWNPNESGRGYSIEVQGNNLFFVGFMYEADGRPVWYFSAGPVSADAAKYSGPLLQFANGQTMTGAYQPPSTPATIGQVDIAFTAKNAGTLTFTKSGSVAGNAPKDGTQTTTPIVPEFPKPGDYVPDDWFIGTFHEDVIVLPFSSGPLTMSGEHTYTGKNLTWEKKFVSGDPGSLDYQYILLGADVTLTIHDHSEVDVPDLGKATCDLNASGTVSLRYPFTSSAVLTIDSYSHYELTLEVQEELLNVQGTLKCVGPGGGVLDGFEPPPFPAIPLNVQNLPGVVDEFGLPPAPSYGEITDTIVNTGPFALGGTYTQTIGFDFLGTQDCNTAFCLPSPLRSNPSPAGHEKAAPALKAGAASSNAK